VAINEIAASGSEVPRQPDSKRKHVTHFDAPSAVTRGMRAQRKLALEILRDGAKDRSILCMEASV
jgi:hypothetical protein